MPNAPPSESLHLMTRTFLFPSRTQANDESFSQDLLQTQNGTATRKQSKARHS
jgi:hypothetical protein